MVQHLRPVVAVALLWSAMAQGQSGAVSAPVAEPSAGQVPVASSGVDAAAASTQPKAQTPKASPAPEGAAKAGPVKASPASSASAVGGSPPSASGSSGGAEVVPVRADAAATEADAEAAAAAKAAAALLGDTRSSLEASGEVAIPAWAPDGLEPDALESRGESMAGTLLRTVLVLGVVLAAIYLTLNVGLRKLMGLGAVGARGNQALVSVVERHAVGPRHSLLVVRAGTDYLVVGQTEGGLSLLSKIEPSQVEAHALARAATPEPTGTIASPFLQKLLARKGDTRQSPPPPSQPPAA